MRRARRLCGNRPAADEARKYKRPGMATERARRHQRGSCCRLWSTDRRRIETRRLATISRALNLGNVPLAQVATLQLHLPNPSTPTEKDDASLKKRVEMLIELFAAGLLSRELTDDIARFTPALHPRWPVGDRRGGQFRPKDGDLLVPVNDPQEPEDGNRPSASAEERA